MPRGRRTPGFRMPKAPRLATLARQINEQLPLYQAKVERGFANTDRKLAGTRLRVPGKGRHGTRLRVRRRSTGDIVLDHNSAETYRYNYEVVEWIRRVKGGWVPPSLNVSKLW